MKLRHFGLATTLATTLALASPAQAVTELQWWHAMTEGNNDIVNKLADEFNASQSDYKVVPSYKGSYPDTMNAGIAAFRAGNAPHIMQVFEVGTATMMSATGAIKPVYQLMKDAGEPFDPKAYLPTITSYYSTSKGDMLSFPFNSSSMVMWINKDELKKAGITEIPKTWPEVFDAAKKLKAAGHDTCGFSNAWASWAHIEQFSSWHNVPIGTKANGLDGFDTKRQAKLHQESGYLPITKAAYEKSIKDGFYEKNPTLQTPLKELTNKEPTENSRGLRFGNMVQMRDLWAEEIEAALDGKKTPKEALDAAVARGNAMLRTFEKTAK